MSGRRRGKSGRNGFPSIPMDSDERIRSGQTRFWNHSVPPRPPRREGRRGMSGRKHGRNGLNGFPLISVDSDERMQRGQTQFANHRLMAAAWTREDSVGEEESALLALF